MSEVFSSNAWELSEVDVSVLQLALNDYIERSDPIFEQTGRKQLLAKLDAIIASTPEGYVASYLLVRTRVRAR